LAIVPRRLSDLTINHVGKTPTCYTQMDRRTDRQMEMATASTAWGLEMDRAFFSNPHAASVHSKQREN